MVEWKFTTFFISCLKLQISFSLKFASLFNVISDNSSLYLFSWNCTRFGQKKPIKMQNFRFSTAHMKFHQICTLIDSFCWKYIKFQLKKNRGVRVMSHDTEEWYKIWRKTDICCFKNDKNLVKISTGALESLKNVHFDSFLLCKVYNVWRVIQKSMKKWLVFWKMTWEIWKIFTRALESVKVGTLMGSSYRK